MTLLTQILSSQFCLDTDLKYFCAVTGKQLKLKYGLTYLCSLTYIIKMIKIRWFNRTTWTKDAGSDPHKISLTFIINMIFWKTKTKQKKQQRTRSNLMNLYMSNSKKYQYLVKFYSKSCNKKKYRYQVKWLANRWIQTMWKVS